MRDQNSTKKTRRWPPRVGKRNRHEGDAPPRHSPKSDAPGQAPTHEERSAPVDPPRREPVVVSRRNRLRAAVARRRHPGPAFSG